MKRIFYPNPTRRTQLTFLYNNFLRGSVSISNSAYTLNQSKNEPQVVKDNDNSVNPEISTAESKPVTTIKYGTFEGVAAKPLKRQSIKYILHNCQSGQPVRIQGWVRVFRRQKNNTFLEICDGSSFHRLPVVCGTKIVPPDLGLHSSVDISGYLHESPKNPTLLEVHPFWDPQEPEKAGITLIGACDHTTYPFGGKIRYEPEYIRSFIHLRPKTNKFSSLLRLRSQATRAVGDFFHQEDFNQIHTPILTSNDCEGAGEVFIVRPANQPELAQPPSNSKEQTQTISEIQTHAHSDLPLDGQKHAHLHKCSVKGCKNTLEHSHRRKPEAESKLNYDNHYCTEHQHLIKDEKLFKEHKRDKEGKVEEPVKKLSPDEIFFNRKTFLTVSGQLHLEAMASGLDKVWTFSPVFRSENSISTRHLCEFYMIEAEMAFAFELSQVLEVMENLVKFVISRLLYDNSVEWGLYTDQNTELQALLEKILKNPFAVMTFDEASTLLEKRASSPVLPGAGLKREQELLLVEKLNNNTPIFVINWPADIKPFYMRRLPDNPALVSAVDLLVPTVGELAGGSLRENNLDLLQDRVRAAQKSHGGETMGLEKSLDWYFDLRRHGAVPTGGFGLGFDRILQLSLGCKNIKDVAPFPRWPHNCPL